MEPTWQRISEIEKQSRELRINYWFDEALFSTGWWVLLISTIVVFIVWIMIVDKKRIMEITLYGSIVVIIGTLSDILGISLLLWEYPISLLHTPELIEVHNLQMPIFYMMIYQYFRSWKSFLIAAAVNAFVFAFIFEPILVWLQIYEQYSWQHIYSLVPYFVIAVGLKWVLHKFKQLDHHYQ